MHSRKLEDSISIPYEIWFAKMLNALSVIVELLRWPNKHFTVM